VRGGFREITVPQRSTDTDGGADGGHHRESSVLRTEGQGTASVCACAPGPHSVQHRGLIKALQPSALFTCFSLNCSLSDELIRDAHPKAAVSCST
ncbi:hypothetical protein KUCAC02_019829, partial [Chaenocephalus aceratus]